MICFVNISLIFLLQPFENLSLSQAMGNKSKMSGLAKLGANLSNVIKEPKGKILCYFTVLALFCFDWPS